MIEFKRDHLHEPKIITRFLKAEWIGSVRERNGTTEEGTEGCNTSGCKDKGRP